MNPTSEQQHAIDRAKAGRSLAIEAGAGTGKTSVLKAIAAEMPSTSIQYVAFNKAIVTDVKDAAPSNMHCNTAHSLAYHAVGKHYRTRLDGSRRLKSHEIAAILSVDPLAIRVGDQPRTLGAPFLASHAMKAIGRFCNSADLTPSAKHVGYIDGIDMPRQDGSRTSANNDAVAAHIVDAMQAAWADLVKIDGRLPYAHDCYLKSWQLSGPRIEADLVVLDEAQDTNPVLLDVLRRQQDFGAQVIAVGDTNQELYAWRGAENALAGFRDVERCKLTHSFRFGPEIAHVANEILGYIPDSDLVLTGRGAPSSVAKIETPSAILTRTNAGAITAVLNALDNDRAVHLVGGGGEIKSFCRGAQDLMTSGSTGYHDLACFSSWSDVMAYTESDPQGGDLKLFVGLIEKYGIETIVNAVDSSVSESAANLVVTTAHKAKGREWDEVTLGSDFSPEALMQSAEAKLLYVAATRAKAVLDPYVCEPLIDLLRLAVAADEKTEIPALAPTPIVAAATPRPSDISVDANRSALPVKPHVGRCQKGCKWSVRLVGLLTFPGGKPTFVDADGSRVVLPRCPEHGNRAFVNPVTTRPHKDGAKCDARCWNAVTADCACPCAGENHGTGHPPMESQQVSA